MAKIYQLHYEVWAGFGKKRRCIKKYNSKKDANYGVEHYRGYSYNYQNRERGSRQRKDNPYWNPRIKKVDERR